MIAERVTPELLRSMPIPAPDQAADKNTRGTVLVAGGSGVSVGAVMLSGLAAFRAGAGKVSVVVPQSLMTGIAANFPEAGVYSFSDTGSGDPVVGKASRQIAALLPHADVALIGPGICNESAAQQLTRNILDADGRNSFVIDALALTGLWRETRLLSQHPGRVIITPNAGEMAQLSGMALERINAELVACARQAATHLNCVVTLKGTVTVIAQPDGPCFIHEESIAGLATSGTGDVLAGVLAGLMARGMQPVQAALWSVYLHARAGRLLSERIGPTGFLARELLAEIPQLMRAGA